MREAQRKKRYALGALRHAFKIKEKRDDQVNHQAETSG
jgi:hypothetical protein